MVAWSKLLDLSCYEVGHTWTPYCWQAFTEVAYNGYSESFKIYAPLYIATALLRRKSKTYYLGQLWSEVLRSTAFLGTNAACFMGFFCVWRYLLGNLNILSSFLPGVCACYFAIVLERKPRRSLLAVYMLNLAIDTMYRMATSRNMITPIRNGEVLLFAINVATFMYFYKKQDGLRNDVYKLIRFFVGSSEVIHNTNGCDSSHTDCRRDGAAQTGSGVFQYLPHSLRTFLNIWLPERKHSACRHNNGCIRSALQFSVRMFAIGYILQAALRLVGSVRKVFYEPSALVQALVHPHNRQLALFFATFSSVFKLMSCLLRWLRGKDTPAHGFLSGFIAGFSMMFYKSSTIAMYISSKLLEVLYIKGVEKHILPAIKYADIIVYTLSTSFLFHAAVFEPHNIRPAYWKFLLRLTHNRFSEMNRQIIDLYGTRASTMYPDFWPDYDKRFTSLTKSTVIS